MFRNAIVVILLGVSPAASGAAARGIDPRPAQAQRRDTVHIRVSDARFVFPVERKPRWQWYQSSVPGGEREYAWLVEVGDFEVGQTLFKPDSGSTPKSGTLEALVWSGQFNVWRKMEQGARTARGAVVNVAAEGDSAVSVWIRDRTTYDMIFESKPATAMLRWQTHIGKTDSLRVVLVYDR